TTVSNVRDVFVYDTTKDIDGGKWRREELAVMSSWYNETLDTASRGSEERFPAVAILVGVSDKLYIYDGADLSLWMSFSQGTDLMLGSDALSCVYGSNGRVYVGAKSGSSGSVFVVDFVNDTAYCHHSTQASSGYWKGQISGRNSTLGFRGDGPVWMGLSGINDVVAAVADGETFFAAATEGGLVVVNETECSHVEITESNIKSTRVALTGSGTLYADYRSTSTNASKLYVFENVTSRTADGAYSIRDMAWDDSGYPATLNSWSGQVEIADLYVEEGRSSCDVGADSVWLATADGVARVDEIGADVSGSSVKYYTKDYITESLYGSVRFFLPMYENAGNTIVHDGGLLGNDFTASSNTSVLSVSGVRGRGMFFGGSDNVSRADDGDFALGTSDITAGGWVKWGEVSAGASWLMWIGDQLRGVDITYNSTTKALAFTCVGTLGTDNASMTAAVEDGEWHHVIGRRDLSGSGKLEIWVDGKMGATSAATAGNDVSDTVNPVYLGSNSTPANYFKGEIDEWFLAAQALRDEDIVRMYEEGKRALGGDDDESELIGTTNKCSSVCVDEDTEAVWIGTNSGTNLGGVSRIAVGADVRTDEYVNGGGKVDDGDNSWNSDDIESISVSRNYVVIGTDAETWQESPERSFVEGSDGMRAGDGSWTGSLSESCFVGEAGGGYDAPGSTELAGKELVTVYGFVENGLNPITVVFPRAFSELLWVGGRVHGHSEEYLYMSPDLVNDDSIDMYVLERSDISQGEGDVMWMAVGFYE
ncbi:LamG-like jellyroll fold domain-containing protein, partial [Candidatus Hydrogenedentota bacterium]